MSRVGKNPIPIPSGVEVKLTAENEVIVKGKRGQLSEFVDPDIIIKIEGDQLLVERPTEQKRHKAMHGLYRALIANMVTGVSTGFTKELDLVGVGFRASNTGQVLELSVGYSHPVVVLLPEEIKVTTESPKGLPPRIRLESNDKQLLGQVAAKIRGIRKPEPYKGKGIRLVNEYIRRKAGKTASK